MFEAGKKSMEMLGLVRRGGRGESKRKNKEISILLVSVVFEVDRTTQMISILLVIFGPSISPISSIQYTMQSCTFGSQYV